METNQSLPGTPVAGFPSGGSLPPIPAASPPASSGPFTSMKPMVNKRSPLAKLKPLLIALLVIILIAGLAWLIITFFFKGKIGGKQITLTYWGLFEPPSVFEQVITDYEKANPKVKISYSQENLKTYRERLQAALERGEGPDLFRFHQSWVPMLGNFLSPIPTTIYDAASFEKIFYPAAKESLRRQGQYVGIPLQFEGLALFYNEDLFQAAGKVPPKTWGELKKTACELTVKDGEGKIITAGAALGNTSNIDNWSDILGLMLLQNGADLANPGYCTKESGSAVSVEEICLGRDALTFYTLFVSEQACQDETETGGAVWNDLMPSSTYSFATGKLAMYIGPSWRIFEIKELNPNLNFKVVSVPQLEGKNIAWSSFWVEGVSSSSKNQEEAWKFLEYLSSKEVLQKLYQTQSALRLFGEPYSRVDMADSLKTQPWVGTFIEQAPFAKNWFLSSRTGDNGINDQIIKYYEDAVNAVNLGQSPLPALNTVGQGVTQVLRKYGLIK